MQGLTFKPCVNPADSAPDPADFIGTPAENFDRHCSLYKYLRSGKEKGPLSRASVLSDVLPAHAGVSGLATFLEPQGPDLGPAFVLLH